MAREVGAYSLMRLQGVSKYKTTGSVTAFVENSLGQILLCAGTNIPDDGDVGFAVGCIFIYSTNGKMYLNEGSATSAAFKLVTSGA